MNWYLLAVDHLAPLSNQTYSSSVDSLVSLHRLMGTLCFGPRLLKRRSSERRSDGHLIIAGPPV